jgi:ABC-type multidrug transport system ATPase subunit
MLRVDGVVTDHGNVRVLRDFSLGLNAGEVIGLLGRNGAGKTTALKAIMGRSVPSAALSSTVPNSPDPRPPRSEARRRVCAAGSPFVR